MLDPHQLWLPALGAGLVAIGASVAIEKLGGVRGGLIASLPSTIVPAALGIFASNPHGFADAMATVPLGMLVNALFLLLWRLIPPRLPTGWALAPRLGAIVGLTLSAWAGAATAGVLGMEAARRAAMPLLPLGLTLTLVSASIGLAATRRGLPAPRGTQAVSPLILASRGLLAATAIGTAVAIAAVGGELLAGIASCFPAIFLTTMVSLWISQGEAVSGGSVGPMMLGSTSVSAFALISALTIPAWGAGPGAGVAWVAAVVLVTLPARAWLRRAS